MAIPSEEDFTHALRSYSRGCPIDRLMEVDHRLFRKSADSAAANGHAWAAAYDLINNRPPIAAQWEFMLLDGFRDYFFGDGLENILAVRKQIEALAKTAMEGMEAATKLAELAQRPATSAKRLTETIQRNIRICEARSPIKRFDATAKERHLAYRFWRGHKALFSEAKPRAIYRLLMVDGIKHQIDERALARLVKSFSEFDDPTLRESLNYAPWHLIHDFRQLTPMSSSVASAEDK